MIKGSSDIVALLLWSFMTLSGGQICTDGVDIQQWSNNTGNFNKLAIIPRLNFTCSGTLTSIRARLFNIPGTSAYPYFQVWRPTSDGSTIYNKTGEVQVQADDPVTQNGPNYWEVNITLIGSNTIEVQSGDVVGYYHPPDSHYLVMDIPTNGYWLYQFSRSNASNSINISERDVMINYRQPLLQFTIVDNQCHILTTSPSAMMSCSSGRVGVGYEGDTCSFTCNTGYELTGNDTRACQSDRSWSGSDVVCRRVPCRLLPDVTNGVVNCSLGDDGVPSYEDTCSFTCDTGYELTGSDTRTCQSDRSWSGNNSMCKRVPCPSLINPDNGVFNCSLGDDEVPSFRDICIATCNTGYELHTSSANHIKNCQSNGSWSNSDATYACRRVVTSVPCSPLTVPNNGIINCSLGDDGVPSYKDTCSFTCNTGYELTGSDTRTCQSNGSWSGIDTICKTVPCKPLINPDNGVFNCSLGDDGVPSFRDICIATCNTGYELHTSSANHIKYCQSNGSWSNNDVAYMCRRVVTSDSCSPLNDPNNGVIYCFLGDDGVPSYEDICSFTCNTGYELTGSDTRTCQSDGSWSGSDAVCRKGTIDSSSGGESTLIIAGSVGGAAVFFIIIMCVIVILYVRRSHKKKSHEFDNKIMCEINSDIKMNTNPSFSITKQSSEQDQYDYVLHDKVALYDNPQGTIKMDTNPSYGRVQSSNAYDLTQPEYDAAIQPNASYSSMSKETTKMSEDEDEDGYVETNSQSTQRADYLKVIGSTTKEEESVYDNETDDTSNVKINLNPSYDSVSGGVKLEDNPSYSKI